MSIADLEQKPSNRVMSFVRASHNRPVAKCNPLSILVFFRRPALANEPKPIQTIEPKRSRP